MRLILAILIVVLSPIIVALLLLASLFFAGVTEYQKSKS